MRNKAPVQQFSFSAGMLDDTLVARHDIKAYYSGGLEVRNMVCLPLGGATSRGALRRCWEFPEIADGFRLGKFEISPQRGFLTLFLNNKIHILSDDLHEVIDSPYSGNRLKELDLNQMLDTMLITEESFKTKCLIRQGKDTSWKIEDTVFKFPPQDTFSTTTGGVNAVQHLKFSSVSNGNSFRLKLLGHRSQSFVWTGDANTNANRIKEILNGLEILDAKTGGVNVTLVSGEYRVEFVGTDGNKDWEDIIIAIEEASDQCRVYTKCITEGKPPLENVWSGVRGWPHCSCNHGGRILLAGSTAKPNFAYASMTNQPFNFHMTEDALDDEAFPLPADTDGNCVIYRVYSCGKPFLFTNKGVFAVTESLLSPSNAVAEKQTSSPCAPIRPVELNGEVVYISQSHAGRNQSVEVLLYSDEKKKYVSRDLAKLSYGLMREPQAIDVRAASQDNNATYLFAVNNDGTLAVLNTDDEELDGWTICDTPGGEFLGVKVVNDKPYFITKRTIKGVTRYFVEVWEDHANLDLSVFLTSETAKDVWDDPEIAFYDGLEVGVYADGLAYGTVKVENNQIELNYQAKKIEIGIPFEWALETMPLVAELSDGTLIGNRHRISKSTIRFKDSAGVFINGKQICNRYFGRDCFDKTEVLLNGTYSMPVLGWYGGNKDKPATIRCTGTSLQPVTILSITTEVIQ